jgi:hypothetical protein
MAWAVVAAAGCSKPKIEMAPVGSEERDNARYLGSMTGLDPPGTFGAFLAESPPADRVKYINKSTERGPLSVYRLKAAYERFVNDPNPDVAAAAKDALAKVPTDDEYKKLIEDEADKMRTAAK